MLKWINKKRNKKGFTLVELVVVIAILGILVALAVPRLTGARDNAAKNAHNSNVRMIEGAVEIYRAEHGADAEPTLEVLETADLLKDKAIKVPKGIHETLTEYALSYTDKNPVVTPAVQE